MRLKKSVKILLTSAMVLGGLYFASDLQGINTFKSSVAEYSPEADSTMQEELYDHEPGSLVLLPLLKEGAQILINGFKNKGGQSLTLFYSFISQAK